MAERILLAGINNGSINPLDSILYTQNPFQGLTVAYAPPKNLNDVRVKAVFGLAEQLVDHGIANYPVIDDQLNESEEECPPQ